MRVYLARHGETTWNREGRYQGRRESVLSALGERQAHALATPMASARIARIISSPMLRCVQTAAPASERCGVSVEIDPRLIEIGHGGWEGRLRDEIAAADAVRFRTWRERPHEVSFEGGEALADVAERWRAFRRDVQIAVPTLLVTHDAVVRVALSDIAGMPPSSFWTWSVENGGYAVLDVEGASWSIVTESEHAHLAGVRSATEGQAL